MVGDQRVDISEQACLDVTVSSLVSLLNQGFISAVVSERRLAGVSLNFKLRAWSDVMKSFVIRQAMHRWKNEQVSRDNCRPVS